MSNPKKNIVEFVTFKDKKFKSRYKNKKIPISELIEAYFDNKVDFKGDVLEFLDGKENFVDYKILTQKHLKFFFTRFIPEVLIHSKKQDERIVREHYDRGNDFFNWFLGERMIYTSGFYRSGDETLETAQDQKMELLSEKMRIKAGDKHLDIGCGWGTLALYFAKNHGTDSTGVTIAQEQKEYGNDQIKTAGQSENARIVRLDYRDIPEKKYNKITCLEMAEHVGVKNFQKFMKQCYRLLEDDGIFYLQIAGLRRGFHPEDLVWGLFMSKYIFSGADASMPLSFVVNHLEKANFEIHSVENIGIHYSATINHWYDNWLSNKEQILKAYGERWFRVWEVFLAWSVQIAAQGSSTCFQIVCNKNLDGFDRTQWFGKHSDLGEHVDSYVEGVKRAPSKRPEPDQPVVH